MPNRKYHRTQAQLFIRLAVISSDPEIAARYNRLALEHLAKAESVEPGARRPPARPGNPGPSRQADASD